LAETTCASLESEILLDTELCREKTEISATVIPPTTKGRITITISNSTRVRPSSEWGSR
jgi:hypothetical protein